MSGVQALHDDLAALIEKHKDSPGVAYPLAVLNGALGHLRATLRQQAGVPDPEVKAPAPSAKPLPILQVAKPSSQAN